MSEFPPGSFEFAERIMDAKIREARREAQAQRLQRLAGVEEARGPRLHRAALGRLGDHLNAWGARLQARYSTEGPIPTQ